MGGGVLGCVCVCVCVCVCCVGETEGCVQDLGREVCLCGPWWRCETLNLQQAVGRQRL